MKVWLNKKSSWLMISAVAVGIVLLVWWLMPVADNNIEQQPPLLVDVAYGPLVISVNASGSLNPRDQVVVSNTLEGRTTILSVVDEGITVAKGDLLIELDASTLQNKLIDQQIVVQNAQAGFVQARENLEVVKNQSQSDIEAARLALQFAQDDLKKYQQGEFPNQKQEELSKITVKTEELRRAKDKLSWSKVLFDEKFISQTELEADQLAEQKAHIDFDLSQSNLKLLLEFTHVRRLTELQAEVDKTRMALERDRRKATANIVNAEADLAAKKAMLERETTKLEKLRGDIKKTVIVAPQAGVVVYATSLQRSWRGTNEPLAQGQEVRERQPLIHLPASGAMVAVTQIHDSNLEKVKVGQDALIYVDSIRGRSFKATVKSVAIFPDATSSWLNPDLKLYRTELDLLEHSTGLRSGMNCRVEILVDNIAETLSVPIQAVIFVEGKPFVFCSRSGEFSRQSVELGQYNESRVQILSGLQRGDKVQINPPVAGAGW